MALLIAILVAGILTLIGAAAGLVVVAARQRREAQEAVAAAEYARDQIDDERKELRDALVNLSGIAIADYARDPTLAAAIQTTLHRAEARLAEVARIQDALRDHIARLIEALRRRLEFEPAPVEEPIDYLAYLAARALDREVLNAEYFDQLRVVIDVARAGEQARLSDRSYAIRIADEVLDFLRGDRPDY